MPNSTMVGQELRAKPLSRLSGSERLNLVIGLPLRNKEALTNLLTEIYDKKSSRYRHYLTPGQFAEKFGPSEADYRAVVEFAISNGLTITHLHANRMIVDVSGSVAQIERVLHVKMQVYTHPTEARTFYAPDVTPTLDLAVPVLEISGLDNFVLPHPADLNRSTPGRSHAVPQGGTGPGGSFAGSDFRNAYAPGVVLTGTGQSIGLVEFDGYFTSDIQSYESAEEMSNVMVTNILLDNFDGSPGANNGEVALDIEQAVSMAPGLSSVILYNAGPQGSAYDILNRMATDNLASQLSSSWLWGGARQLVDQIFMEFAAQGQSYFNASGDEGAYSGSILFPGDDPFVTIVGGTTLSTDQNGSWQSEVVWPQSGGGVSPTYSIPAWQEGINMDSNGGSTVYRNLPDVALVADNVWVDYNNGAGSAFHGTSCAAPLWAAYCALVNQQGAGYGQPPVGFLNPSLTAIGLSTNYADCFHDITVGNNTNSSSPSNYVAVPGFDLCTGWGTPAGQGLIDAFEPHSYLSVSPEAGFEASGLPGGPFNPPVQTFSVSNAGPNSLAWSLADVPPWLSLSSTNGILAAGSAVDVDVVLNSEADALTSGVYLAAISFEDETSGISRDRNFTLQISPSLVLNGGFETGTFADWTLNGSLFANMVSGSIIAPFSGQYCAVFGQVGSVAYLSETVPTLPGQPYLLSFWLANPSGGTPNQFLVNWNTNSSSTNTLLQEVNLGAFDWTNEQFVVVASDTNSTLQFGFEDDPQFLALDNVNLIPIQLPEMQMPIVLSNGIMLSWNAFVGLRYQLQYTTNLTQGVWTDSGDPILATNAFCSAFDYFGTDSQRFYRLIVGP